MKILHVIDQISQKTGGGASKVCFELARAQAKLGHKVTIYTTDYNAAKQGSPQGVKLVKFKNWFNFVGVLSVAPSMLFARYNYDVMHLHNWRTIINILACMRKCPTVIQAHGNSQTIKGLTKPLHDLLWGGLILRRAKKCIADADVEVDYYLREGVKPANIKVIPVGINLDEFKFTKERKPNKVKNVLYLGRYVHIKGIDLLVKAFKRIEQQNIKLQISGIDYGCEGEIKALVTKLGLDSKVEYLGPLYGTKKTLAYTNADVFVMPSRYEMWGLTFMEALACGTPVVMTDTCEASKILPPECGMVVPFNEGSLAGAISNVIGVGLVDRHRQYRRQWAKQYSWGNLAPQIVNLYQEAIS